MFDASIFEGKTYQLVDILDHERKSKANGSPEEKQRCEFLCGCYTNYINIRTFSNGHVSAECLDVWFEADIDGAHTRRHLRTSPIKEIDRGLGRVIVHTANSIYAFKEAPIPEPEYRKATNLVELWFGKGVYKFDKGVHYDRSGDPHILTIYAHLGTFEDSFLISYRDDLSVTVARYFRGFSRIEFYDTLYGQQEYDLPMLIHNTSEVPLTIEFDFCNDEYVIAPGSEQLINPPDRKRKMDDE